MSDSVTQIDDRDSSIFYSAGQWDLAGTEGLEYLGTTTETKTEGATAILSFTGSGIRVVGTVPPDSRSQTWPRSLYVIDGASTSEFSPPQDPVSIQYGRTFFEVLDLPPGDHTLRIIHGAGQLFLDSFFIHRNSEPTFSPRPTLPQGVPARQVDDRDGSVSFSSGWNLAGNLDREYNGTTRVTNRPGASAVIPFTGTGIAVVGTIGPPAASLGDPTTQYTIDNSTSPLAEFRGRPNANTVQYNHTFFQVQNLSYGPHTLTIQVVSGDVFLDYFLIYGEEASPKPEPSSSKTPIGAIVGGAVGGGAALIIILVVGFIFWRRRKRGTSSEKGNGNGQPHTVGSVSSPFPYPTTSPPSGANVTTYPISHNGQQGSSVSEGPRAPFSQYANTSSMYSGIAPTTASSSHPTTLHHDAASTVMGGVTTSTFTKSSLPANPERAMTPPPMYSS